MKKIIVYMILALTFSSVYAAADLVVPVKFIKQMEEKGFLRGYDKNYLSFDEISELEITEIGYIISENLMNFKADKLHAVLSTKEAFLLSKIYDRYAENISFLYGVKREIIDDLKQKMDFIVDSSKEMLCTKKISPQTAHALEVRPEHKRFARIIDVENSDTLKKNKLEYRLNAIYKEGYYNDIKAFSRMFSQEFIYGITQRMQLGWEKMRAHTEYSGNDIDENIDTVTFKYRFAHFEKLQYTAGYRYFRNKDVKDQDHNDYFLSIGYPISRYVYRSLQCNLVKVDHRTDDLDGFRFNLGLNYQISKASPFHLLAEAVQNEDQRFQYLNVGLRIINDPATVDVFYKENLDSNVSTVGTGVRFLF